MATTTRLVLLEKLSKIFDDWWSDTTTSVGNVGGTQLIDTSLKNRPNGNDNDAFITHYVRITSGTNDGETRRVSAYTASSGTLTVESAYTGQVASGVTYELHRVNPVVKHNALSAAGEDVYPVLFKPIRDQSIVVDDLLSNSDFESTISGGSHPSWTNVNSPTVTTETSIVYHGSQAAKIVSHGSSGAGQMTQAPSVNAPNRAGKTVLFKRWAYSAVADEVSLLLDFGGADAATRSSYHDGDSAWRLLSVSAAIPTDATQVKAICEVIVGSKTAYFDGGGGAGLFMDPVYKYTTPTDIIGEPHFVRQQYNINEVDGVYYNFLEGEVPEQGKMLQIEGKGMLSLPTTDSGTYEIGSPRTQLLLAYACRWMLRAGVLSGAQHQTDRLRLEQTDWKEEIARLEARPGMTMVPPPAERREAWQTEEGGKYIIFNVPRQGVFTN